MGHSSLLGGIANVDSGASLASPGCSSSRKQSYAPAVGNNTPNAASPLRALKKSRASSITPGDALLPAKPTLQDVEGAIFTTRISSAIRFKLKRRCCLLQFLENTFCMPRDN